MKLFDPSRYSAAESALGYLFQIRLALLLSLRQVKVEPGCVISLEVLDDISFENLKADHDILVQAKHHQRAEASLTDASPQLWKTIRIWAEMESDPEWAGRATLCLVTTATASSGSIAAQLKAEGRDVPSARRALDLVAQTSGNRENEAAYAAYLGLDAATREALVGRIKVFDQTPTVGDLSELLAREIHFAVLPGQAKDFLERLEGWWFARVIENLSRGREAAIEADEIDAIVMHVSEGFRSDSLPIDDDVLGMELNQAMQAACGGRCFVRQLQLVEAGARRLETAIISYMQATEQRARWLKAGLVGPQEIARYEARLVTEWRVFFAQMEDELGAEPAEEAMVAAGRRILAWAEQAQLTIRQAVTERFVARGTMHHLADTGAVGWHREFRTRLANLLHLGGAAA